MDSKRLLTGIWLALVVGVLVYGMFASTGTQTLEMQTESFFTRQYSHNVPYPKIVVPITENEDLNERLAIHNVNTFQWVIIGLMFLVFLPVRFSFAGSPNKFTRVFRGFCLWIRDEMVVPVMGKSSGQRFLPYFLTVFFFIFFMNVMGLVPGSATPTASVFVTAALALTTLAGMIGCGMIAQGPVAFWKNLVPHVPLALWPLMFIVERMGLLVKPFALMVRLFANMSGGHMVVLSFMGLFFFLAQLWGTAGGWGSVPIGVGFAVFIMIIEAFVAMLQAYIFTQLSIVFIGASVHPEH